MTDDSETAHRSFSALSVSLQSSQQNKLVKDGSYSWVICFAAFIVQTVTFGILNSFGLIFVELLEEFKVTKAELSWIASLAYGASLGMGPLAGAYRLRFGSRVAISTGGVFCATSLLASSFAPNTKALFGTFSLLYAMGGGLVVNSTTILAADYFDKYIAMATGMVVAGGSCGTLLFAYLTEMWVESVGWRYTFRIYSGISILTIFMGLLVRPVPRPPPRPPPTNTNPQSQALSDRKPKLWQNRVYVIWVISITSSMFGYYIPYVHLIAYAVDIGLTRENGSVLLMVIGGTSALARLFFGKVLSFQFLNRRQIHQLSMMITATSTMMLPISTTMGALVMYSVVQGLVDGCNVVLMPLLTRTYAGNFDVPIAWGILNGISSVTFILGPPVAGWLYDATGSYNIAFHMAGIPLICGSAVLFFIPWAQSTTSSAPTNVQEMEVMPEPKSDDNYPTVDSAQVIVGMPIIETTRISSTVDVRSNDSHPLREFPTESAILNENNWDWHRRMRGKSTMELEVPPPPQTIGIELHKTNTSHGMETRAASEESEAGFVFVNLQGTQESSDDKTGGAAEEGSDTLTRAMSPVVIRDSIIQVLENLNETSESQPQNPAVEQLVELKSGIVNESFEEIERTDVMADAATPQVCHSPEEASAPGLVIPDYVVEKLVELNETEQNKSSSDAAVDTLVNLSDDEGGLEALGVPSGTDLIIENEDANVNPSEQPQKPNKPFSRQASESQVILPSSVVETLEILAHPFVANGDINQGAENATIPTENFDNATALNVTPDQGTWSTNIQNASSPIAVSQSNWVVSPANPPADVTERSQQQIVWNETTQQHSASDNPEQVLGIGNSTWGSSLVGVASPPVPPLVDHRASSCYQILDGYAQQSKGSDHGPTLRQLPNTSPSTLPVGDIHWSNALDNPQGGLTSSQWGVLPSQTVAGELPIPGNANTVPSPMTLWTDTEVPQVQSSKGIVPEVFPQTTIPLQRYSSASKLYPSAIAQPSYDSTCQRTSTSTFNTWANDYKSGAERTSDVSMNPPAKGNSATTSTDNSWWRDNSTGATSKSEHPSAANWCSSTPDAGVGLTTESPDTVQYVDGGSQGVPNTQEATVVECSTNPFTENLSKATPEDNESTLQAFDELWTTKPCGDSENDTTVETKE